MDLEMTSLRDATKDKIIEIAVVLTDANLNLVADGPDIVINVEPELFEGIPDDTRAVHAHSGIIELVARSTTSMREAEQQVLEFLKIHVAPKSAPLCGNTIHTDRHFLRLQMPELHDYLFYRSIDVSSIKELARRWAPSLYEEAEKRKGEKPHRAMGDVMNSIEELKYYRDTFFKL